MRPGTRKANEIGFRARTPGLEEQKVGPCAGAVRARVPAKPMNSVYEREPWGREEQKAGSAGGAVRAWVPAKPMNSVFEREPWVREEQNPGAGKSRKAAPKRRRSEPGSKKFAPQDEEIRARREGGANLGPGVRPKRGATASRAVKSLLPKTEE